MKTSLLTRLIALAASIVMTLVTIVSMALVGHPQEKEGAALARAGKPVFAASQVASTAP